eukprot:m51a1_g5717 hypothetical protein (507) ;mRNA; r:1096098-1097805
MSTSLSAGAVVSSAGLKGHQGAAPLWSVLGLTTDFAFVSSVVSVTSYFPAKSFYLLSTMERYVLALVEAAMGLPAPLISARVQRRVSARRMFLGVWALMAALCVLPEVDQLAEGHRDPHARRWVLFVLIPLYSFGANTVWCIIEAYVTAGRKGREGFATSAYCVAWSSSIAVSFFVVSPVIARWPLWLLASMALVQLSCAPWLLAFPENPTSGAAPAERSASPVVVVTPPAADPLSDMHSRKHGPQGEPQDPVEVGLVELTPRDSLDDGPAGAHAVDERIARLSVMYKWLVPANGIVFNCIPPILPDVVAAIGVGDSYQTLASSAWLFSRAVVFLVMWRLTRFWRGSHVTTAAGLLCLLGGFATILLTPVVFAGRLRPGLAMLVTGQVALGAGMSMIYNPGLCYSMELGHDSNVSTAARFESLLNAGYLVCPLLGVISFALEQRGVLTTKWSTNVLVISSVVVGLALIVCSIVHAFFLYKPPLAAPRPQRAQPTTLEQGAAGDINS